MAVSVVYCNVEMNLDGLNLLQIFCEQVIAHDVIKYHAPKT